MTFIQYDVLLRVFLALALFTVTELSLADPELSINGVTDEAEQNIRAFLKLSKEDCSAPRWRIQKTFDQSDRNIEKALKALGYYHPEIEKKLEFDDDCWQATYSINAGPPVIIQKFNLQIKDEAKDDAKFKILLSKIPIHKGDILNHGKYESIKQDLKSLALEQGYLDADFVTNQIKVNPAANSAVIDLIFSSGPRYYFGSIHIDQDILDPDFMQRFITIEKDEYYSSQKLASIYNNLAASNYFKSINMLPKFAETENLRVPVNIALQPKPKHNYNVGIGYDTNYGPIFSAGYQNRRVNRYGHNISLSLDVSPVLSTAEARYIFPLERPVTDSFSIGVGYKHEEPDTFVSDMFKTSAQWRRVTSGGWENFFYLDLVHETYKSADVKNSSLLLIPGTRISYSESNSKIRPTRGYQVTFTSAGSHEYIISDVSFIQGTASGKVIWPAPFYGRFITRADLGAMTVSNFDNLPVSYRFYAGGTQSIRGYAYKELGPTNEDGEVIGGQMLTVVSIEYEKFINDTWGVATFIDSGNAYNTNDISFKTGVGLGLRWSSPVGPIRIDFAVPLNDANSSFQIHFAAGAQL